MDTKDAQLGIELVDREDAQADAVLIFAAIVTILAIATYIKDF